MQVPRLTGSMVRPDAARPAVEACPPAEVVSLDELYRRLAPSISRWAERLGGPDLDLEDVVHDILGHHREDWIVPSIPPPPHHDVNIFKFVAQHSIAQ